MAQFSELGTVPDYPEQNYTSEELNALQYMADNSKYGDYLSFLQFNEWLPCWMN